MLFSKAVKTKGKYVKVMFKPTGYMVGEVYEVNREWPSSIILYMSKQDKREKEGFCIYLRNIKDIEIVEGGL